MYPKHETCDKIQCLENLVGIRSLCVQPDECAPFFLEDIEGVDITRLAKIAKGTNLSGADFGRQLINSAAREMMGDVELLILNGFSLNNIVGEVCSSCNILPTYTPGAGITIRSNVHSMYQELMVTKLNILTNATGQHQVVIDDGIAPKTFNVTLQANTIMPVLLNYRTTAKAVHVYLADNTVGMGQVVCTTQSSCGCGASQKAGHPVLISGYLNNVEVTVQYGFLPCASVVCSYDQLVCNMIKQAPNIFGMTLLFKVAEKYYLHRDASDRNNAAVSFNDDGAEEKEEGRNYGRLYWSKMHGTTNRKGVKQIISDFLKTQRKDKCVICDARIVTGHITG